ncbi:MAG TPA: hypothetical protein VNY52_06370 [Solirubrobacteraceae bacterium]|nr:hypothetical protein [Solirubrobacteraceae bacterium]
MSVHKIIIASIAALAGFAGTLAYATGSAGADVGFEFIGPLTDGGTAFGGHARTVTVDDRTNGDVLLLVTTSEVHGVEVFKLTHAENGGKTEIKEEYVTTLTGAATPGKSFGAVTPVIAVNNTTGYVYVADLNHGVVDMLELEEINTGKEEIKERYRGQLEQPGGIPFAGLKSIAVDQMTGDVYVVNGVNRESAVVDVFNSVGEYQKQIVESTLPPTGLPPSGFARFGNHIAVDDHTGDLFIAGNDGNVGIVVYVLGISGEYLTTWTGKHTPADAFRRPGGASVPELSIAADNASGYVFVVDPIQGVVDMFDPANALEETYKGQITGSPGAAFGEPQSQTSGLMGIAVDQASEDEYVLGNFEPGGDVVDIFGPPTLLPTLTIGVPSGIQTSGATVNGAVNPEGTKAHEVSFEYGPGACQEFGSKIPGSVSEVGPGNSPVPIDANLTNLLPGSEYCYRLAASSPLSEKPLTSPTQRLITAPALTGEPATSVSEFAATLHATVEPGEVPTTYHFAYGPTKAYGSTAPIPDTSLPIARGEDAVSQDLTGLRAGTTYHFAVVVSSAAGTFTGSDQTFMTSSIPAPAVSTVGATGVTVNQATLAGAINPQGWDTTYSFQYGTTTAYGATWPTVPADLGALAGEQPISIAVQNLLPATTYHYRLVATNGGGTSYGADGTFTTAEYPPSAIGEAPIGGTFTLPSTHGPKPKPKPKKKKKKPAKAKHSKGAHKATHTPKRRADTHTHRPKKR